MPKQGFRSITVRDNVYKHCQDFYEEHREGLSYVGVTSFSGFMTWIWEMVMGDDYIHDRIKQKMKQRSETITNLFN